LLKGDTRDAFTGRAGYHPFGDRRISLTMFPAAVKTLRVLAHDQQVHLGLAGQERVHRAQVSIEIEAAPQREDRAGIACHRPTGRLGCAEERSIRRSDRRAGRVGQRAAAALKAIPPRVSLNEEQIRLDRGQHLGRGGDDLPADTITWDQTD
jgi:hypothetical protein